MSFGRLPIAKILRVSPPRRHAPPRLRRPGSGSAPSALAALACGLLVLLTATAARAADGDPQSFVIKDFKLESGAILPQAEIIYGTFGKLNPARDNVVLVPSHYMAERHGYGFLVGPGLALDPAKYFVVATELFGNGESSSPSNTPEPLHGPRFPVTTIRDNVEAVHHLLTERLGLTHIRAVVGFSMGGQQAFQWAVSYPQFADKIVVTSATAKTYSHGIIRLEGQIAAITADPTFADGDYTSPPTKGLEAFGLVWGAWLYSQQWWRDELWRVKNPAQTFEDRLDLFRHHFLEDADANDLILQMRTWQRHDVGTTPGFNGNTPLALQSIKIPVLYMPSATDLYFPAGDATYEAGFIGKVTLRPIPSLYGHPAGAGASEADKTFLNDAIRAFLAQP